MRFARELAIVTVTSTNVTYTGRTKNSLQLEGGLGTNNLACSRVSQVEQHKVLHMEAIEAQTGRPVQLK